MACMGPENPTKTEIDAAYNRVMEVLAKEFDVFTHGDPTWPGMMLRAREKVKEELRNAVREILYQEACESF